MICHCCSFTSDIIVGIQMQEWFYCLLCSIYIFTCTYKLVEKGTFETIVFTHDMDLRILVQIVKLFIYH